MYRVLAAIPSDTTARQVTEWLSGMEARLSEACHITLLHVLPVVTGGVDGAQAVSAAEDLEEIEGELKTLLADKPAHWDLRTVAGEPGVTICTQARDFDLLVIGTHRRTRLSELIFGSTGSYVLHNAPCPVTLVR